MLIDIHAHLLGSRQDRGCYLGPRLSRGPAHAILRRALGLGKGPLDDLDDAYAARLIALARTSGLDGVGVLAFDGVYDDQGELDLERTSMMVGNDYCLEVCAREPLLLPICSVNPQRADALDELERVAELGAVAIKFLPNSQGFDPGLERYRPFWRRMAELGLPLLTHTSFEHTVPPLDQSFGKPRRLIPALEEGAVVIAAHCAGSGVAHPFAEDFGDWLTMLSAHPNLYGDISAMASISRFPYIHKVLASDLARERVVLGSDFPVPVHPLLFARQLGMARCRELAREANPIKRNLETFRALGVDEAILRRGATLLRLTPPRA